MTLFNILYSRLQGLPLVNFSKKRYHTRETVRNYLLYTVVTEFSMRRSVMSIKVFCVFTFTRSGCRTNPLPGILLHPSDAEEACI